MICKIQWGTGQSIGKDMLENKPLQELATLL